jgi:ribosomal-protein-alanine N-acetyltransferase
MLGNFADSLKSGYQMLALMGGDTLIGYFVAMQGVDEVHLLNITVAPEFQGQGYGVLMLDALSVWARSRQAQWLWLEVRVGNIRAMQVYERFGYRRVGERKHYYPASRGHREHAVVMSLKL